MSKGIALALVTVASIIAVALLAAESTHIALAGVDLRELVGSANDWHLLTRQILPLLGTSSRSMAHVIALNLLALAALTAVSALLVLRSLRGASPVLRGAVVAASGLVVGASPLSAGLVADPLGFESCIAIALLIVLVGEAAGLLEMPELARVVVVALVGLQDYLYLPALLICALAALRRQRDYFSVVAAAVACGIAAYGQSTQIMHTASVRVAVVLAATCFVVAPLLLFLANIGVFRRLGWQARDAFIPVTVAATAVVAAIFSPNGDPAAYLLAAQISLLLALTLAAGFTAFALSASALVLVAFASAESVAAAKMPAISPTLSTAREISALNVLVAGNAEHRVCIYGDPAQIGALDAKGAFETYYESAFPKAVLTAEPADCLRALPGAHWLILLKGDNLIDFGAGGADMATAVARAGNSDERLTSHSFIVRPFARTRMPGGHGAFANKLASPSGPANEFVIAAPFDLTVSCVRWRARSALSLAAIDPLADVHGAGGVRFIVRISGVTVLSAVAEPRQSPSYAGWKYYSVPLPGAARCADVTFSARPAGANGIATWLAVLEPAIIQLGS